jgi:signal transduction histidine kinase
MLGGIPTSALGRSTESSDTCFPTVGDLAQALSQLQESTEAQISSLAQVLHDDLGGLLVSAIMDVGWFDQTSLSPDLIPERLSRARRALAAAIDLKRSLIESLRPSILDNIGLLAAFRWHITHACGHAGTRCTHTLPEQEPRLRPGASIVLFRIGQEMLSVVLAEPVLKSVDLSAAIGEDEFLIQVAHEHYEMETTNMLDATSGNLRSTLQRIDVLKGRWSIHQLMCGSVMRAAFPWDAISAVT